MTTQFPYIDLSQSFDLHKSITKVFKSSPADRDSIAKALGYSPKTSRFKRKLNSLLLFGLLSYNDGLYTPTPITDTYDFWLERLMDCELFRKIYERHQDTIPDMLNQFTQDFSQVLSPDQYKLSLLNYTNSRHFIDSKPKPATTQSKHFTEPNERLATDTDLIYSYLDEKVILRIDPSLGKRLINGDFAKIHQLLSDLSNPGSASSDVMRQPQ